MKTIKILIIIIANLVSVFAIGSDLSKQTFTDYNSPALTQDSRFSPKEKGLLFKNTQEFNFESKNYINSLLLQSKFSSAGGMDGGGGTSVSLNGQTLLLSLFEANQSLVDTPLANNLNIDVYEMRGTNSVVVKGKDLLKQIPGLSKTLSLLSKNNKVLAKALSDEIKLLNFYFDTICKSKKISPVNSEKLPTATSLNRVATYVKDINGPIICLGEFKKLGNKSVIALIIKETLRQIESTSDDYSSSVVSEGKLRALVARITLSPMGRIKVKNYLKSEYSNALFSQAQTEIVYEQLCNGYNSLAIFSNNLNHYDCTTQLNFENVEALWFDVDSNYYEIMLANQDKGEKIWYGTRALYMKSLSDGLMRNQNLINNIRFQMKYGIGLELNLEDKAKLSSY